MAKKKKDEKSEEVAKAKPEKKNLSSAVEALMKDGKTEYQARQVIKLQSR